MSNLWKELQNPKYRVVGRQFRRDCKVKGRFYREAESIYPAFKDDHELALQYTIQNLPIRGMSLLKICKENDKEFFKVCRTEYPKLFDKVANKIFYYLVA